MGPRLNLIGASVATDTGDHADVQIIVRNDEATISTVKGVIQTKGGVSVVEVAGTRARTVRFADGSAWDVVLPERKGGCGCR